MSVNRLTPSGFKDFFGRRKGDSQAGLLFHLTGGQASKMARLVTERLDSVPLLREF